MTQSIPLYQAIANVLSWCPSEKFEDIREYRLKYFQDKLPHGSGFDSGCTICPGNSSKDEIVITFSYHHMDSMGGYIGWTDHTITIWPSLIHGFVFEISPGIYSNLDPEGYLDDETDEWYPKQFSDDEDFFYDTFRESLSQLVNPYPEREDSND